MLAKTCRLLAVACLLLSCVSACRVSASVGTGEQGDGVAKTETRDVAAFTAIAVDGTVKLDFTTGPLGKLTITGDENLLPLIGTEVVGGKLTIHETKPVHSKTPLVVSVHAPALVRIDTTGVASVIASGLEGSTFTFNSTGVADAQLSGQIDSLEITSGGAGNVRAGGLAAKQAHVLVSGAGNVEVDATDKLKVDVSGVGNVRYRGAPAIEKNVSGMGSVGPLG
jgi:hypothetical protein